MMKIDTLLSQNTDASTRIFSLLFFCVSDRNSSQEIAFEEIIFEVFKVNRLSAEAKEKIRAVYEYSKKTEEDVAMCARLVVESVGERREVLLWLTSILLRVSLHDGMCYREDKRRLIEILRVFDLSPAEFCSLPHSDREVLEILLADHLDEQGQCGSAQLADHYKTLGCSPNSADDTLRAAFRQLVKQFHPDGLAADASVEAHSATKQFMRIKHAYDEIQRVRQAKSES